MEDVSFLARECTAFRDNLHDTTALVRHSFHTNRVPGGVHQETSAKGVFLFGFNVGYQRPFKRVTRDDTEINIHILTHCYLRVDISEYLIYNILYYRDSTGPSYQNIFSNIFFLANEMFKRHPDSIRELIEYILTEVFEFSSCHLNFEIVFLEKRRYKNYG